MLKQTIIYVERCDVLVRLFGSIFSIAFVLFPSAVFVDLFCAAV